jgi:hypothetical protein
MGLSRSPRRGAHVPGGGVLHRGGAAVDRLWDQPPEGDGVQAGASGGQPSVVNATSACLPTASSKKITTFRPRLYFFWSILIIIII